MPRGPQEHRQPHARPGGRRKWAGGGHAARDKVDRLPPPASPRGARRPARWPAVAVGGLLVLAVAAVFGRTAGHPFVNYDDNLYVYGNSHVTAAGQAAGIAWAFTSKDAGNWHPLTWLSHRLDCRLYGPRSPAGPAWPGGHHLSNVLLHGATAVLLFLLLERMTGRCWTSALAAAVFALHPLRVESVAWVAERKDVLGGLFFLLTLLAYLGYARRPSSLGRYLLALGCFALGLMAKPMLVTLPGVLLLLDYWPLARMGSSGQTESPAGTPGRGRISAGHEGKRFRRHPLGLRRLIVEKLPFLTLAAASCLVTLWAQAAAIAPTAVVPWVSRLANAPIAYFEYLGKFFWPADLAVFYPHPPTPPAWRPLAAVLGLAGLSTAAWLGRRTQPWLLVGWLWYLGMLVPVIGIVQVGSQGMADRYTYLPEIGLAIAIVWAASTALRSPTRKRGNLPIVAAVAILLAVLMAMSWRQTSYWRSSEALWTRALDCTGDDNVVAHINLGWALKDQGRLGEAIEQYRRALEIRPDSAEARNKLGVALALQGKLDEALAEFILAVKFDPQNAGFRANLERARAMSQAAGAGHAAPAESRPR